MTEKHSWSVTPQEAIAIQIRMAEEVVREDGFIRGKYIAGVDVGIARNKGIARAAITVLDAKTLEIVDSSVVEQHVSFPYVPGLLSFRELPPILEALKKIQVQPDIILCDGQGIAHPRRFGVACHLGLLTDTVTIGVAKNILVGKHGRVPSKKGRWTELYDHNEIVGAVLRSRENVKPIYVSIGHKICLESAVGVVMDCVTRFRLPETSRSAHSLSTLRDL